MKIGGIIQKYGLIGIFMDIKIYKFNKKYFFISGSIFLILLILLFCTLLFVLKKDYADGSPSLYILFLIFTMFYACIYPILLMVNHYIYDIHSILTFNVDTRMLYYENKEYCVEFNEQDIDCVISFQSYRLIVSYNEFILKNGKMLYISTYVLPYHRIKKDFKVELLSASVVFLKFLSKDMNTVFNKKEK